MVYRFLTLLFLLISGSLFSSVNAGNPGDRILPYYENGMLAGVITEPFEIESEQGHTGKVQVGYSNLFKIETVFIKILPGSDIYSSLDSVYNEIMASRYELMELYPEYMGLFGPQEAPLVKNMKLDIVLGDGTVYWNTGSRTNPWLYNCFNVEYTEDPDNFPRMLSLTPGLFIKQNSDKEPKFKEIEKAGINRVNFKYGDLETGFNFKEITPSLIKNMKKTFNKIK